MSTIELINRCIPWCPGWEASTGRKNLLKLAEQGVDELYEFDHDNLIFRPGNTGGNQGFPPYLITTAAQYKYDILPANLSSAAISHVVNGTTYTMLCRKVKRILQDITITGYLGDQFYGEQVVNPYFNPADPYGILTSRSIFTKIGISSTPMYGESEPASITFQKDPGTTTTTFFIEFYVAPPRLNTLYTKIPIPLRFEKAIEDYVIGSVQERESGQVSPMLKKFYDYWIPEFRKMIVTSASVPSTVTPPNYA